MSTYYRLLITAVSHDSSTPENSTITYRMQLLITLVSLIL